MNFLVRHTLLLSFITMAAGVFAQGYGNLGDVQMDERELYTMTKQVSQFFSRFNYEEDQYGKKIFPNEPFYRDKEKRKTVLPLLFDMENQRTSGALRDYFVEDLTKNDGQYLEFLGGKWFAEVSATFEWKGRETELSMILAIEKENLGSKWVLTNVFFSEFSKMFKNDEDAEKEKYFLHPMSHELDFMNIHKAFNNPEVIEYYAYNSYSPDYLTLFFYEIKQGNLKFKDVNSLKFHIFQINNWYFEISWFNRSGYNSGWLISNLIFTNDEEKAILMKYYNPILDK